MGTRRNPESPPTTATEWFAVLADERSDTATRAAFTEWLRESPTHIRELLEVVLLRAAVADAAVPAVTLQEWIHEARASSVECLIPFTHQAAPALPRSARLTRRYLLAAVAAVMCVMAAAAWWLRVDRYDTRLGEQRIISLRDGSMVSLNTDSEVRVDLTDHGRTVELAQGEAFFEVKRDPLRPFRVEVGNVIATAIGTSFNVRAGPQGAVVGVAEGKVEVRTKGASNTPPVALIAGEQALIAPHARVTRLPDLKSGHAAAWMQGRIEFESATLDEVAREFARYRQLHVAFADDTLRQRRITGSFNSRDPEAMLAYIDTLPDIRVARLGDDEFRIEHDAP